VQDHAYLASVHRIGSGQHASRSLVRTQNLRLNTAQMRQDCCALPYTLVSLQYRAWRRPAGRASLEPVFFHGSGGGLILYGRERRIPGGLRSDYAALCLYRFSGLCRPMRGSLCEAPGTAAGVTAPASDIGVVGALCGGLAPRPLADRCHMARFWSPVLAAYPGRINQPRLLGPGRTTVNVRQGKRLFSLIGSGDLAASILGGFATPLVIPLLGTHNLLLGSALSLLVCLGLLIVTLRKCTTPLTTVAEEEPTAQSMPHSLTQLLKQRYVVMIFLIQMLLVLAYYFVDFTFLAQTKAHYQTEAQFANFLGPFLGMVETVNFLTRTLIPSRLITRYGLRVGLLVHPIVLMGCSVVLAVTGATAGMSPLFFWLTAFTKLCDEVLWKSIMTWCFSSSINPYQRSSVLRSTLPCKASWGHSQWP
jgi:hypothetical protein